MGARFLSVRLFAQFFHCFEFGDAFENLLSFAPRSHLMVKVDDALEGNLTPIPAPAD
jgi:hypothetical protein